MTYSDPQTAAAPLARPGSIADGVHDAIYERLMALAIPPGARIMIDALARELGVSQTPVREALGRLESEGLVRKAHLIGYSAAPQLTRAEFADLYDYRLMVEPLAAGRAAARMTPADLAALERLDAEMGTGDPGPGRSRHYARFARADGRFHDAVLRIAGNAVLRATLAGLHVHLHIFRFMVTASVTREAREEHRALIAALAAGDAAGAEAAMRLHIERSRDRLLAAFDEDAEPDTP